MRGMRIAGSVAALVLCALAVRPVTAAAQSVTIQKRCLGNASGQPKARVGDAFTCTITVVRTVPNGPDFRVDGVFDVVHHTSGDAGSGNLLAAPVILTKKGSTASASHSDVVAAGDPDPLLDTATALVVDLGTGTAFLITAASQIDVIACLPGDPCDDGRPCTVDTCNASNTCVHAPGNAGVRCRPTTGACDVEERCTGTSADCPADAFLPSTTVCRAAVANCDIAETCSGTGPTCPADRFVSAGTVCRSATGPCDLAETCSGASATCPTDRFVSAGAVCRFAAGECDLPEACSGAGGACPADARTPSGTPCSDDGNVCTNDQCDGTGSCLHPNNTAPCSDGLFCNGTDTCRNGACTAHAGDPCATGAECARTCEEGADRCFAPAGTACTDDGSVCTRDQCDGGGACAHPAGNAGTVCRPAAGQCDRAETCSGTDITCPANVFQPSGTACADDGNACTDDQCNGAGSCLHPNNTAPCSDGLFCNGADTCRGGTCSAHSGNPCLAGAECARTCDEATDSCLAPAGIACTDDGNVCTNDRCDGGGSCVHPHNTAPCSDGLFCNGTDTCRDGACTVHAGDPCATGAECARTCEEGADRCFAPAGTACTDDGSVCTRDQCDGNGACAHPAGNAGTVCRPAAGQCDRAETCSGASGTCPVNTFQPSGTACADDGNACTDDQCNGAGICLHPNSTAPCSDGLFCNGTDTCRGGTCSAHTGDPCLTGTECARSCDEAADSCVAPAGTACTDDGNACTDDQCDGGGGCLHPHNTAPCSDGLFCNGADTCRDGGCRVHAGDPCLTGTECARSCDEAAASCLAAAGTPCADDGNACTDDQCNGSGGCLHPHNTAPCSDGLFCNGTDTCRGGTCSAHTGDPCLTGTECARSCDEAADSCVAPAGTACTDDGNACTDDQCDGGGGCLHPHNTAPCSDGLFCNGADTCRDGGCRVHAGDPCAAGPECARTCDEAAASCSAAAGTPCADDGNPCTADACDGGVTCRHSAGNAGAVCRPVAGACDVVETCTGSSGACPPDTKSTDVCRPATDDCDAAERCDGVRDDCPPDALADADAVCRPSAGECDPGERCDGEHAACPEDAKSTAECRPTAGPCDLPESCDGTNAACPPESVAGAFVLCRPAMGACDVAEHCDGAQVDCPPDLRAGVDVVCRPPTGVCDVPEHCTGIGADCPADARARPGSACPDDDRACTTDTCDGDDVACQHTPGRAGLICRPGAGPCDAAEVCTGTAPDCPPDGFLGVNVVCRASVDQCDVAERCDGSHPGCPADARQPDGASCNDRNACTRTDTCRAGTCVGAAPVACGPPDACHAPGTCDAATGTCSTPLLPSGSPCDDGDACTANDSCQAGICSGTQAAGCCSVDADCDDGFACTEDRCVERSCVHAPVDTRCGERSECAAPVCDPAAPDAQPSGCTPRLVADAVYCSEDGDPCTQDTCVSGTCTHPPDGSGTRCTVLGGPFRTAADLLERVNTLATVVGHAVSTDCVAIGQPPGCEVVTGPRGPASRLLSLVDAVQRDAALVVLALGGRLANTGPPGTLQDPTVRVQFALTVLVDTPNNLRAFVATVGQGRTQHQVSPAFARSRRAEGKALRGAAERLRRELRRLLAQRSTFVR